MNRAMRVIVGTVSVLSAGGLLYAAAGGALQEMDRPDGTLQNSAVDYGAASASVQRGHRFVDNEGNGARIIVILNDSLVAGEFLQETLPLDVSVQSAWGVRVKGVGVSTIETDSIPVTVAGQPGLYTFSATGAATIVYSISRDISASDAIDGNVSGGLFDGIIEQCWDDLSLTNIVQQVQDCWMTIKATIADALCQAFSIIPGFGDALTVAPYDISFDDTGGPFVLSVANEAHWRMSAAIGSGDIDDGANRAELAFAGQTLIPFMRGDFASGAKFRIVPDPRNAGKRAAATITITGGNTGLDPYGYEGWMGVFAANPFFPAVVPAMAVVADQVQAEFLGGTAGASVLLEEQLLNAEFVKAIVAAPGADTDTQEPQGAYTANFDVDLADAPAFPEEEYIVQAHACVGSIVEGIAGSAYNYLGNLDGSFLDLTDPVSNRERGVRFEEVSIDFHHMELSVDSVRIDEYNPLEGTVVDIVVGITNSGTGDGENILVSLYETGAPGCANDCDPGDVPVAVRTLDFLAAGQDTVVLISWYTCGGFYGGLGSMSYMCVTAESQTIAEIDYADNCLHDPAPVTVQPSVIAAFVSESDYGPAQSQVSVWNTRLRLAIGSFDLTARTSGQQFEANNVAVPNNGQRAWVIMDRQIGEPAMMGMDVTSCWTGLCNPVGVEQAMTDASHSTDLKNIAVNKRGSLAFCPYNLSPYGVNAAIYPLDHTAGAQPVANYLTVSARGGMKFQSHSAIAMATTSAMREENYVAINYSPKDDRAFWFRVIPNVRAPSDATQVMADSVLTPVINTTASSNFPKMMSVDFAPVASSIAGDGSPIYHARGDRAVFWDNGFRGDYFFETVKTAAAATVYAEAAELSYGPANGLPDIAASHTGRIAWAIHEELRPWYFYSFDPSNTSPTSTSTHVLTNMNVFNLSSRFVDLAFKPACSVDDIWGDEVWIADEDKLVHIYDQSGLFVSTFATSMRPRSITIAPIEPSGEVSIAPAPLPVPNPLPGPWPLDVNADYDFLQLTEVNTDWLGQTYIPIMNRSDGVITYVLEFQFPDSIPAVGIVNILDPDPLTDVPPFDGSLANLSFVPIEIGTSAAVPYPVAVKVRAYPVGALDPAAYAANMLRMDYCGLSPADCNGNGILDDCDIVSGLSPDCDGNAVPDECDIAGNSSLDENGNGLLDACEGCTGVDSDFDGISDECDNCLDDPNPDQRDVDFNGIGDVCDCACDCTADPHCDGTFTVLDVVKCIDVAFRNGAEGPDPNPNCPNVKTDVNCDGVTSVTDVVKIINVAFRNESPESQFCDPCAP